MFSPVFALFRFNFSLVLFSVFLWCLFLCFACFVFCVGVLFVFLYQFPAHLVFRFFDFWFLFLSSGILHVMVTPAGSDKSLSYPTPLPPLFASTPSSSR